LFVLLTCEGQGAIAENGKAEVGVTRERALEIALRSIHDHHLTSLRDECVSLSPRRSADGWLVHVYEVHGETCGGAPGIEPRLFTISIDERIHRVRSDWIPGGPPDEAPDEWHDLGEIEQ
jgi:hypothetical protein